MPAGDAQRAWFPEMIERLRELWRPDLTWDEVIALLPRFEEQRLRIKEEHNIRTAVFTCKTCGAHGQSQVMPVSVRSLLFALEKSGVVSSKERKRLESAWRKHQTEKGLNGCGQAKEQRDG